MQVIERPATPFLPPGQVVPVATERWLLEPWHGDDPPELKKIRFSLSSSAATDKVRVAPSSRSNKIGQVPLQKVSPGAEAAKPVNHAA